VPSDREIRRLLVSSLVADIHARSRGTYGMLRIRAALKRERGMVVNKHPACPSDQISNRVTRAAYRSGNGRTYSPASYRSQTSACSAADIHTFNSHLLVGDSFSYWPSLVCGSLETAPIMRGSDGERLPSKRRRYRHFEYGHPC
jgi:hypothetical protein